MRAKSFLSLFFLSAILIVSTAKATESKPVLPIEHWTTKNGIPVYFVAKSQIPMVDIGIVFRAGSAYDGTSPGIAQFTAQMLDQGTHNLNADQIATRFESVGAHYNAAINQDMAILNLRSLSSPQFFNSSFNTFVDIVSRANFPQVAIDRIKKQTEVALQQEAQTPTAIARNAFYQALYNHHSYAVPLLGTNQSIKKITSTKLIDFYQRYYVAKNAVIAIVGNVTKAKAVSLAEQLAIALPQGEKATLLPAIPTPQLTTYLHKIAYPSQQSTIFLGQIGITLKDPNYFPLILGNQILGGGILTSQLFTEVRNKRGLCYGISSRFNTLEAGGPFIIVLQTRNDQASTALTVTQSVLKKFIEKGPSEKELEAAKQALIGSFPLTIANNAAILGNLEKIGFYKLPLTYLDSYREKLNNVNINQVRYAFQKHINPKKLLIVMLGDN
ncbi:MAG: pitrilysin family protein [Pseudomonadota bacterium]